LIASTARRTSPVGSASGMSPLRWWMRLRVLSSLPIGSWTPVMPRSPHTMPQGPIAVSKIAKLVAVMAHSNSSGLRFEA